MRQYMGDSDTLVVTEGYVNERGNRVLELIDNGTQFEVHARLFAPGVDQLLAADHTNCFSNWTIDGVTETYWALTDQQGTVRDLFEYQGVDQYWHQHVEYDAFGVPSLYSGVAQDVGALHAGREYDFLTDLYYNRARWYDAAMQRFISEDPARGDVNPYRYCNNSPINATDPSGCVINVAAAGIGAAVGGIIGGVYYGYQCATGAQQFDGWELAAYMGGGAAAGAVAGLTFGASLAVTGAGVSALGLSGTTAARDLPHRSEPLAKGVQRGGLEAVERVLYHLP